MIDCVFPNHTHLLLSKFYIILMVNDVIYSKEVLVSILIAFLISVSLIVCALMALLLWGHVCVCDL